MGKQCLIALFLGHLVCGTPFASQEQNYGLGGITTGRANAVTAEKENAYAAHYNPALIAAQSKTLLSFSTASTGASFSPLRNVVVDHPKYRTIDSKYRKEDFTLPNSQTMLWSCGITYPFRLPSYINRGAGFGLVWSGPYGKFRSYRAGTPYDFYSLRYGAPDNQIKITPALSMELWPGHLYLGGGLSIFTTSSGAADSTIVTQNPSMRMSFDVGLNASGIAGLYFQQDRTNASLVYHQEINPSFTQKFEGKVQVTEGSQSLVVPFLARASLYYEPHSFEAEIQRQFASFKASLGVAWQWWSRYQPSYIIVEATDSSGQTRTPETVQIPFHNTLNPRASLEIPLVPHKLLLSTGYAFRPSPVEDLEGSGNILDANTHIVGLDLRYRQRPTTMLPLPVTIGIYGQYHFLKARSVTKSDPDFVGAPGYEFKGGAYAFGASFQAEL